MKASGGGGCSSPPPLESSATVSAIYAIPRIREIAPVTIAVPWPGFRPAVLVFSGAGGGDVVVASSVLAWGLSGSSANTITARLGLHMFYACCIYGHVSVHRTPVPATFSRETATSLDPQLESISSGRPGS